MLHSSFLVDLFVWYFLKTAISILKQEYKIDETKLTDALRLAIKILSKTLDTTKLTSEKSNFNFKLISLLYCQKINNYCLKSRNSDVDSRERQNLNPNFVRERTKRAHKRIRRRAGEDRSGKIGKRKSSSTS